MKIMFHQFLTILVALSLCSAASISKSVAIDLGNEWFKACLMNPQGLSLLEVVINEQSERRSPSVVGFDSAGDRVYGDAALSLYYRNPTSSVTYLKSLLGVPAKSPIVQNLFKSIPAPTLGQSSRGEVAFKRSDEVVSLETLVTMLLQWTKSLTSNHLLQTHGVDSAVTDAVLVVPEGFSTQQRALLSQLAKIAGYEVKTIINELTAAAIDYGLRNVQGGESKHIVIYGVSAKRVSASLFQLTLNDKNLEIKVLATESDDNVGGLEIDLALQADLIALFDKEHKAKVGSSISSSKKALAKLLREARNLKEQLSASPLGEIEVLELFEGKDFRTTYRRDRLEELTESLVPRFLAPLNKVMEKARHDNIQVSCIELYGGGVRVPKIQNVVSHAFATIPLGRHIDGDEGALFGAAHYSAVLSGVAAAKPVHVDDPFQGVESSDHLSALTEQQFEDIRNKLADYDRRALEKSLRQESRNKLETYIMETKSRIDENKKLAKDAKTKALEELNAASMFLEDTNAQDLSVAEWKQKEDQLKEVVDALVKLEAAKKEDAETFTSEQKRHRAEREYESKKRKEKRKKEQQARQKKEQKKKDDL